jgi:cysteine desulfurase / selenocysteine lyase
VPHDLRLRRDAPALLDVQQLRRDFPVLVNAPRVDAPPLIYLDSAATAQKPRAVIDALDAYYAGSCANVHRGTYSLEAESTAAYEAARDKVARFVGAPDRAGVIFTKNCTEAINLVAYAWARRRLRPGEEILVTPLEHHSNLVPWQMAARDTGAVLCYASAARDGALDLARLDELVSRRTRLVCVTGMSNVLGAAIDLGPLVAAARAVGALVLVDAAQLVAHQRVDVRSLDVDFLAFSGHKVLGPTGIGVLVGRVALLDEMEPFLGGGEMIRDVTLDGATWNDLPYKFEAGTPPIAEAIGLGAAVDYLTALDASAVATHERELTRGGLELLGAVEGLTLYGARDWRGRAPIFAFNLHDDDGGLIHPHDVETLLAAEGVAIRAGHHCAKPLMRHLAVPATCRASCALYNTVEELARLAAALERARRYFRR